MSDEIPDDHYSVAELDKLKEQMAHNAIRTTLQKQQYRWDGDAASGWGGAGWDGRLPPVNGPTGKVKLKWYSGGLAPSAGLPPGAQKSGDGTDAAGQAYTEYEVDAWADIYEPWIDAIDQAFQGWDTVVDPGEFDAPIQAVQRAVVALTALPPTSSGGGDGGEFDSDYTGVDLTNDLDVMDSGLDPQWDGNGGRLVLTFRDCYGPKRIESVMRNQMQAAMALGIAMLGTQRVWKAARVTIMEIAEKAVPAFEYGGAGGGSINLEVVKAFADLIGTFAPPPVKAVTATGSAAISLIQAVAPQKPDGKDSVELEGYWPEEVLESVKQAIEDLEKSIYDHEYEIAYTTLSGLIDDMQQMKASDWHMHPDPGMAPELENAPDLGVKVETLRIIGYDVCTRLAAVWGRAAEAAQAASKPMAWNRSAGIGLSVEGAYPKWSDLLELFDDVTTGSGQELVQAGVLLAQGAGYVEDADHYARDNLKGVRDDLDRGELGYDGQLATTPGPYGPY